MKKSVFVSLALAVVVLVGLVIFVNRKTPEEPPTVRPLLKTSVRMKWFFAGTMTGWFAGKEQGIFAKNGIDITITPGGPQNSAIKLVAAGSDDFGVAGADEVILARAKGIPVVALTVLFKENPLCYISRANSGITTPNHWRGKKIEVSYGENAEYLFRALLKKYGIKKDDYKEIPYTFNVTPFLQRKVDVSPAYAMDQAIIIEKQGISINKIFARDFGINPYADVIITTEKTIRERPDLVRAFVSAAIASQQWAIAHPEEAVSFLVKHVPDFKRDDQLAVWRATIPYITPNSDTSQIGRMSPERWFETQQVLLDSGALEKTIDIAKAFTNTFIPQE